MSKKKIIILIIILVILVGLVWFFWPKKSYFWGSASQSSMMSCRCLGIEKMPKKYLYIDGISIKYCYGIVYNCVEK